MTVRRCVGEQLGRDDAARPRDVLDDERLPEHVRKPRAQHAAEDVGISAGARGGDDPHGLRRVGILRQSPERDRKGEECYEQSHV